jgi:hypothetical protein
MMLGTLELELAKPKVGTPFPNAMAFVPFDYLFK